MDQREKGERSRKMSGEGEAGKGNRKKRDRREGR